MANITVSGSFRDPAGFVFSENGNIYRQINKCYIETYQLLLSSGLYDKLKSDELIISHEEADLSFAKTDDAALVIKPTIIPFISYPYEWCFSQYKDAAMTTLKIHKQALLHNMVLKDASAYNIQFYKGKPVLIDTLSFETYQEGTPWSAYGQFCRHFLSPLFLMVYSDFRLSSLMRNYIDGIPIDLASRLLKGKGGISVYQHIHLHSAVINKHSESNANTHKEKKILRISKFSHIALIDSLIRIVEKLHLPKLQTEWGEYYKTTNYSDKASKSKKDILSANLLSLNAKTVWDLGANDGTYSRLIAENANVIAFDLDHEAIEKNYYYIKNNNQLNILPLIYDINNPSPNIGFANKERVSISERQHPDLIIMLAVIHHVVISNNVPMLALAEWLSSLSDNLIIEFVPKEDSQVKRLLETRLDIFPTYHEEGFESAFTKYYHIVSKTKLVDTFRTLYCMKKNTEI
jgi:2-polyprenyl-3-methyl-5-hydroxy-6-metoxy-1,4-benzoquinol methylase